MDQSPRKTKTSSFGFTLAELLIAILILGEIATFTIPKLIINQQNNTYNAKVHEGAGMIAQAYQQYQFSNNPVPSSTTFGSLTPYMNYVKVDTSSVIDDAYGWGTNTCSNSTPCLVLHSGAILRYVNSWNFAGTSSTNVLQAAFDPDGTTDGTTNGPGKAVVFELTYPGRVTSQGAGASSTPLCGSWSCPFTAPATNDPPWFSW